MLGREIRDPDRSESDIEFVPGLNLLNLSTVLEREKVTRQATARLVDSQFPSDDADAVFSGYEIHLGETRLGDGIQPLFELRRLGEKESHHDGAISADGRVLGTYLHGLFDSKEGLALILNHWRKVCGKPEATLPVIDPVAEREKRYDALAENFRSNLRMDVIYRALDRQR
jgi:adenosylcobyric acid synthase